MNCAAEPMLDFLQRTLGFRGPRHNHHADYLLTFFPARQPQIPLGIREKSSKARVPRNAKSPNPQSCLGIRALRPIRKMSSASASWAQSAEPEKSADSAHTQAE